MPSSRQRRIHTPQPAILPDVEPVIPIERPLRTDQSFRAGTMAGKASSLTVSTAVTNQCWRRLAQSGDTPRAS
jgi:hypothetical protein